MKNLLRLTLVLALVAVAAPGFATEAPDLTVEELGALVEAPETVELQGGPPCLKNPPTDPCICPAVYDPVCGCNGVTYSNSCFASCEVRTYTAGACGSTS